MTWAEAIEQVEKEWHAFIDDEGKRTERVIEAMQAGETARIERLRILVEAMEKIMEAAAATSKPPVETPPVEPPGPVEPPESPSTLPLVPFTEPPLLLNHGSWDKTDQRCSHEVRDGKLVISVAQNAQPNQRVIRRDFGLQKPGALGGGFLREPAGKLRRYEIKVHIPEDYDPRGEMCNLFQAHTHSAKAPPYLSFFLWSKTSRWRHNLPNGGREDYAVNSIKPGHTYSLAVEALWSKKSDGILRVWEDGKSLIDHKGPNYRSEEDEAPYWVLGQYYPSAANAFSNTVSFSQFRIGDL